jgi:hypothetical protein
MEQAPFSGQARLPIHFLYSYIRGHCTMFESWIHGLPIDQEPGICRTRKERYGRFLGAPGSPLVQAPYSV